ncbi:MAG: hypothetical protein KAV97_04065 [Actinomycetia bacterium]|nr:hypothetical protein [Actinomycetes bacterium]
MIAKLLGFKGKIRWGTSKSDGQPRRKLDTVEQNRNLDMKDFTKGLKRTIERYRKSYL